jgi:hypothetical protein
MTKQHIGQVEEKRTFDISDCIYIGTDDDGDDGVVERKIYDTTLFDSKSIKLANLNPGNGRKNKKYGIWYSVYKSWMNSNKRLYDYSNESSNASSKDSSVSKSSETKT